mmetsp:Transcript_9124/g.28280  ORF Transcript_9124/g.28280 Transcript_9124/m.28280 type:complete len:222 (+) Transcript_9124:1415-2080(+)
MPVAWIVLAVGAANACTQQRCPSCAISQGEVKLVKFVTLRWLEHSRRAVEYARRGSGSTLEGGAHLTRAIGDHEVQLGGLRTVGHDANLVDVSQRGRLVARHRHRHRRAVRQRHKALNETLSEGSLAKNQRPVVILEGAGQHLGRAGGAAVDQDHDRVLRLLRGGHAAILRLIDVLDPDAVRNVHHHAARHQLVRNLNRGGEQPAGVIAQVHDEGVRTLLL